MSGATRAGVEVGGTFTDLVAFEDDGVRITKVPSTPSQPHRGAIAALDQSGLAMGAVGDLVHGSTVATNAVLERKGARVAFVATEGFRDILALQRQSRRSIYDIHYRKPAPVVPRSDTFEIPERIGPKGEVVTPLDEAAATDRIRRALDGGDYESVAVCFLNSYANPAHERRIATIIAERFPDIGVTCSCDVTREFREYERASTTVLAAYVQPVIDRYLKEFERELGARSFDGRFSLMQSNGGRLPARGMADNAITSLFSGPAAGVMGAIRQAERSGYRDLVTFDMGGTSTDVCLVRDGVPTLTSDAEIDGLPIRTPVLDIVTVGAGGGSIVWRDDGGMLRVGPQSAGAEPGPACYRRGGANPTITDAHIIRGTVLPDTFLGGRMEVDADLAHDAFDALAAQLRRSVEQVADDAVRVAEHNIVRAIQLVSTERGRDPRDYVLVPFGGAGPLHAARVAEVLSIGTIVIPPAAGVLSAFGLVASDFVRYGSRTVRFPIDEADAAERVREQFREMRTDAERAFAELGITSALRFTHTLEMRYIGQAFEVPVTLAESEIANLDSASLRGRFNEAHHRIFEFDDSRTNRPEIVSFRLGIASPPPSIPELAATEGAPLAEPVTIFDGGERRRARRLNRRALRDEGECEGPMLISDDTSTAYVPPGWSARIDAHHNVILNVAAGPRTKSATLRHPERASSLQSSRTSPGGGAPTGPAPCLVHASPARGAASRPCRVVVHKGHSRSNQPIEQQETGAGSRTRPADRLTHHESR